MNIVRIFEKFPTQEELHCPPGESPVGRRAQMRLLRLDSTPSPTGQRHACLNCKVSFSVTVGTIFHHTHLPLQKWFLAIMLMLNAKKGISALQLSRDIGVNKNTAWRINMQIRKAMSQAEHRDLLQGIVEMDETYIGGKPRKGTKGDGEDGKPSTSRAGEPRRLPLLAL